MKKNVIIVRIVLNFIIIILPYIFFIMRNLLIIIILIQHFINYLIINFKSSSWCFISSAIIIFSCFTAIISKIDFLILINVYLDITQFFQIDCILSFYNKLWICRRTHCFYSIFLYILYQLRALFIYLCDLWKIVI